MADYAPGIHLDIDELEYHALPGLSSTGIKRMLQAPAVYRWHADHPAKPKSEFELGHAVHARVLGVGLGEVIIPGPWNTNARKAEVAEAREAGWIPLKPEDAKQADAMAKAVLDHRDAAPLLRGGQPEVSLIWDDPETGVRCRGRIDYAHDGVLVDFKTAAGASPDTWGTTAARYGYDTQKWHYSTGWEHLTGVWPRFLHVVVTKEEPYLAFVAELDADFDEIAAERVRQAIDAYAKAEANGRWPGFGLGIHRTKPPRWHRAGEIEEF